MSNSVPVTPHFAGGCSIRTLDPGRRPPSSCREVSARSRRSTSTASPPGSPTQACAYWSYDHRGFGDSDGQPRQDVDPWTQIHDCQHAISYARSRADVDAGRIGVWGTSFSGGHALRARRHRPPRPGGRRAGTDHRRVASRTPTSPDRTPPMPRWPPSSPTAKPSTPARPPNYARWSRTGPVCRRCTPGPKRTSS